jgi:hypothetical protein
MGGNTQLLQKKSQNRRIQGFSYYLCMMIEGSGSRAGSGSIPLTSGSGSRSGRPKNTWIRWIRIRIRKTDFLSLFRMGGNPQLLRFRVRAGGRAADPLPGAQPPRRGHSEILPVRGPTPPPRHRSQHCHSDHRQSRQC